MRITSASVVGREVGPEKQRIDARWLMAYSAALGETDPRYYDTAVGVAAHALDELHGRPLRTSIPGW